MAYRGRLTFYDIYNMPAGMFQVLYKLAIDKNASEEGKKENQAIALEEELQGVM